MDCRADDRKTFKVFEAPKRNKARKRRDGQDTVTDESSSAGHCTITVGRTASAEPSLQNITGRDEILSKTLDRGSFPDLTLSHDETQGSSRSPRRNHRRPNRESLALTMKHAIESSPRSSSPQRLVGDTTLGSVTHDQDSIVYNFLEEAIKKDKKKQRQLRRHEERRSYDRHSRERHSRDRQSRDRNSRDRHSRDRHSRDRHSRDRHSRDHYSRERKPERDRVDQDRERDRDREREHSPPLEYYRKPGKHHRRHKEESPTRTRKDRRDSSPSSINQMALLETFAKLCTQVNDLSVNNEKIPRSQSHKSLQCQVEPKVEQSPSTMLNKDTVDKCTPRVRSQENMHFRTNEKLNPNDKCNCCGRISPNYSTLDVVNTLPRTSKLEVQNSKYSISKGPICSRNSEVLRYPHYNYSKARVCERSRERTPEVITVNRMESHTPHYIREANYRDQYLDHDEIIRRERLTYPEDDRHLFRDKTNRSCRVRRERYIDDDKTCRRSIRSDSHRDKRYESKCDVLNRDNYYDEARERHYGAMRERATLRKFGERLERASISLRDEDYKERSPEAERDSGLSVADGDTSTISGRSYCMRAVKQEILEQREAMDKMMNLWKELMRCFKGMSKQGQNDRNIQESAENARDSAAAQLKLWRECMRRYETVARDVGDTDARLMEEIKKQRSEMSEMASMWQECLQRYRDICTDFNALKQQVAAKPVPEMSRAPPSPPVCAEGEGPLPGAHYRLPTNYPPSPPQPMYMPGGGSPLGYRASAPPAWWWSEGRDCSSTRRPRTPESRGSRDRKHRHKERDRDRDDTRYREKPSKPGTSHSEHRHRKR